MARQVARWIQAGAADQGGTTEMLPFGRVASANR